MTRYIPHAVFRHILGFKDPTQQVGVRRGIKTDSASAMPLCVHAEMNRLDVEDYEPVTACMVQDKLYYSRTMESYTASYNWVCEDSDPQGDGEIKIWRGMRSTSRYRSSFVDGQLGGDGKIIKRFVVTSRDNLRQPSELWLQCEACGADLELYQMLRR